MLALTGHSGQVTSLAFSPDGRWLATAGWDGTVRLWERPAYRQVRCMRTPYDHATFVTFSFDSSYLAICFRNRDNTRHLDFGAVAWTPVRPAEGSAANYLPPGDTWSPSDSPAKVAVMWNRQMLAIHRYNSGLTIWDPVSHKHLQTGRLRNERMVDIRSNPDGVVVLLRHATNGDRAWVMSESGPDRPAMLPLNGIRGTAVGLSADGTSVFAAGAGGQLAWWTLATRPRLLSRSSQKLLRKAGLRVPDVAEFRRSEACDVSAAGIADMSISPDGSSLLLACEDGQIRQWDVNAREVRATYDWKIGTIQCVAHAPDGLTAAAAGDGVVLIWDVD